MLVRSVFFFFFACFPNQFFPTYAGLAPRKNQNPRTLGPPSFDPVLTPPFGRLNQVAFRPSSRPGLFRLKSGGSWRLLCLSPFWPLNHGSTDLQMSSRPNPGSSFIHPSVLRERSVVIRLIPTDLDINFTELGPSTTFGIFFPPRPPTRLPFDGL